MTEVKTVAVVSEWLDEYPHAIKCKPIPVKQYSGFLSSFLLNSELSLSVPLGFIMIGGKRIYRLCAPANGSGLFPFKIFPLRRDGSLGIPRYVSESDLIIPILLPKV